MVGVTINDTFEGHSIFSLLNKCNTLLNHYEMINCRSAENLVRVNSNLGYAPALPDPGAIGIRYEASFDLKRFGDTASLVLCGRSSSEPYLNINVKGSDKITSEFKEMFNEFI